MAEAQPIRESARLHRRDTRRHILLPAMAVALLLLVCIVGVLLMPRRAQVSAVSDFVLTILVLCPLALCFLPVTVLSIGAVFGMSRAHEAMKSPLYRLEDYSNAMVERTETMTERVNRQTINISARFGAVYKLLGTFEPSEDSDE